MKFSLAALAITAAVAVGPANAAKLRDRVLEGGTEIAPNTFDADAMEARKGGRSQPFGAVGASKKSKSKGKGTAIITNVPGAGPSSICVYQFEDKDDYQLIGSERDMICANNVCNVDLPLTGGGTPGITVIDTRIIGLNLTPDDQNDDEIKGSFGVVCTGDSVLAPMFTCPSGYRVKDLVLKDSNGPTTTLCSTAGQVCTETLLPGIIPVIFPVTRTYTLTCKENPSS